MSRACFGAATLLALLPAVAAAQDPSSLPGPEQYVLRAQYGEFRPSLSGKIRKSGSTEGTLVDIQDDLAVQDRRTYEIRGALQIKEGRKLRGSYTRLDYDGDVESVDRSFTYGETRFLRFERVVTSVKGAYYGADIEWDFIKGPKGYLGLLVGAKLFDIDAVLVSPTQGPREQDTIRAPIPILGLATRLYTGRLSVEAEASGLSAGDRGSLFELQSSVRFHISDRLAAMGGYRYLSLKGKDGQDEMELDLGGWQFGLEISL